MVGLDLDMLEAKKGVQVSKEIRGVLNCGCVIFTDGSYSPCDFHKKQGYFTKEETNQLCLELAADVLAELF